MADKEYICAPAAKDAAVNATAATNSGMVPKGAIAADSAHAGSYGWRRRQEPSNGNRSIQKCRARVATQRSRHALVKLRCSSFTCDLASEHDVTHD